jgi:hypothetical protein
MAIFNYVQSTGTHGTTTATGTLTMTASSTQGDVLFMIACWGAGAISSVTDSLSNEWIAYTESTPATMWYVASSAPGTATITFHGPSESSNSFAVFVSEYTAPPNYFVFPTTPYASQQLQTATTYVVNMNVLPGGTYGAIQEGLAVIMGVNTNTGSVWTLSTGSMRGTAGTSSISVSIGDYDVPVSSQLILGSTTATQTTAGTRAYVVMDLVAVSVSAPFILQQDWDAGFVG